MCGVLTAACVCLALHELGCPWERCAFNTFGQVMKANESHIGLQTTQVHAVYWGMTLLCL
jgi:hypothetical protein